MAKLIVANFKSHKNRADMSQWLQQFSAARFSAAGGSDLEIVLVPAWSHLVLVSEAVTAATGKAKVQLGVPDLSSFPPGAYTGAVSAENLDGYDAAYALVGHSERRRYFHETHADVANKVEQALGAGMTPIVCLDDEYLALQAAAIAPDLLGKCVVAYEPLEAIGSGTSQPVAEVVTIVKKITDTFGSVPVLYGGSVDEKNIGEYLAVTAGVLVGSASLDADHFGRLITAADQA